MVASDFDLNNLEIKKMTKYQDLKNEMKRSWKLKSTKIVPVIIGAMGMMKNNLRGILKTIPGNRNSRLSNDPEKRPRNKTLRTQLGP